MMKKDHEKDDSNKDYNNIQGQLMSRPPKDEEIFITGLSGTFPNSTDIYDYQQRLYSKVNMVLPNRRWNLKHPEIPNYSGTIPEIHDFDGGFFGIHYRQGHALDVMCRLLMEKTVEAIFDAGLTLKDLEGTRTGVYVGACVSESEQDVIVQRREKLGFSGVTRSAYAQRISYFLKLKGPSFCTDTACSSSLYAVEHAFRDLRLGVVDAAIVCGCNVCFHPYVSLQFARLGVLSLDGSCKVFDKAGNGYARSEAICSILLQKGSMAKRNYGQIIYAKTNCDGFKEAGITYPSGESQKQLLTEVYNESGVNPADLSFLEAHGTGTVVGDPEECMSIDEVLAKCRKDPLFIGSVKSNMGHSEPASGLCSIAKCIISLENGYICPNIHFNQARDVITGIQEGRLQVITEKTPFKDNRGLIGINSFGFGGGNCHLLIKGNAKQKLNKGIPNDDIPRVVCISGRTEEAIQTLCDELKNNTFDAEYIRLLHNVFRQDIPNHIYRGYSILSKSGEICRFHKKFGSVKTPLYLVFDEFDEWQNLGRRLLLIPNFSKFIEKSNKLLLPKGIDIHKILFNDEADKSTNQVLGSILVQMGLIDLLKELEIKPTNCFGYSYGELLTAYFNGTVTFNQIVESALVFNEVVNKINGLREVKDAKVVNGNANVAVATVLDDFRSTIKSIEFLSTKEQLLTSLSDILDRPQIAKFHKEFGSADYFVNALLQKSFDKLDHIQKDSILLTSGDIPSLKKNVIEIISLVPNKDVDLLEGFLNSIGKLYVYGYNPQLAKIYPEIQFPVSKGTRMISPFIKWRYNRSWRTPCYNSEQLNSVEQGARFQIIDLSDQQWSFIQGHTIDGRTLFPATGYLYIVWETLANAEDVPMTAKEIIFEDIRFLRATTISKKNHANFLISINIYSGRFEILEGGSIVVTGKIYSKEKEQESYYGYNDIPHSSENLISKDIYKELRLRGYNYSGEFRQIKEFNPTTNSGLILWKDNWVSFMDNMLQLKILQTDTRLLYVPTYIARLEIPAKSHLEWVNTAYLEKEKEPLLPVSVDPESGNIRCGFMKINGLIASSIPRRKDLGMPVLEKHQFVPNITSLTLQESVRVNTQILLENVLIKKVKCVELIDEYTPSNSTLTPFIQTSFEDQPLIQPLVKIISKLKLQDIPENIPFEDKELKTETECNLIVASRLLERPDVLKVAHDSLKDNGFLISRESIQSDSNITATPLNDFTIFTIHHTPEETIVFLQKKYKTNDLATLDVSSSDELEWIKPLQDIIETKKTDNVVLYAQDKPLSGILGFTNCIRREPESSYVRCLFVVDHAAKFDKDDPFYKQQLDKNMAVNIWKNNTWGTYRHLRLENLENIKSEHCFLNTTNRGDLSSLKWLESNLRLDINTTSEKVMVYVHYASLNFRDVMTATGKINVDVITKDRLQQECIQGIEFSGYTADGRRVMGMVNQGAMSTLTMADEYLLFDVPESISLKDAATIPVVYGTVIYGLMMRTKLEKGESILIHSGTGGIGQAAIRVALHCGCEVFTTVGSPEKKEFLLKTFPQLKPDHIGNSRDLSFARMIRKYTKNRGVDTVLNSLAEEKLQMSIRCLARGGRFVEIGKFDLGNNNELKLSLLKKEASFHGIMLDQVFEEPEVKKQIHDLLKDNFGKFVLPLPATCFNYDQVEEAFRFMASGKHIGKVVVKVREEEKFQKLPQQFTGVPRYFCHPDKTYIIIGGLGGFGLELADWLILKGATSLVLTSRNGISTGYQQMRIKIWKSYGVKVQISTDDICTEEGCRNLLLEANKLGEVQAIFNLAVVLADAVFENQTTESFQTSLGPKAVATSHLDKLSRELCPNLAEFVIFSSVSCGRGNAGQTNYGMANSIMERICEQRLKDGYPALAIQWGAIADVGLIAELQEEHVILEIGGTLQQNISSCLNVLNTLMRQKDTAVVSSIVVAEKRGGLDSCDNIIDVVINILGLPDAKHVSHHTTLPELGMDSMTGVEIKQILEREYDITLSSKDMKTLTLAKLKEIQEKRLLVEDSETEDWNFIVIDKTEVRISEIFMKSNLREGLDVPKVFLFPGIEGFANIFKDLAEQLDARVIAFQYWENDDLLTIQDIVDVLLQKIERNLSKNEKFTLIGHSFGSLIALELAGILESKGYVGNLVIIDGGKKLMKTMSSSWMNKEENLLESSLLCHFLSFFLPKTTLFNQKEKIFSCNSWNERLEVAADLLKEVVSDPDRLKYQKAIFTGIYSRIKSVYNYKESFDKLKSKIALFKPSKPTAKDLEADYELSKICDSDIYVETLEGNHLTILKNDLLAKEINSFIKRCNEK